MAPSPNPSSARTADGSARALQPSGLLASLRRLDAVPGLVGLSGPGFPDAADKYAIGEILRTHQHRAVRVQAWLRACVFLVVLANLLLIRPHERVGLTLALTLLYGVWSAGMIVVSRREHGPQQLVWAVALVDLPFLAVILGIAGAYTDPNWSTPLSPDAFIFVPLLASFQLSPFVTAVSGLAATVTYTAASGIGHLHASPDLHYTLTNGLVLATLSVAGVVLSRIQQSRVRMIAELARQRGQLLARTVAAVDEERRDLAEALHDGPLQNVLAARLDLDEAHHLTRKDREATPNPAAESPVEADATAATTEGALDRADEALREAARQLRSSVTELHPASLEQAGVSPALRDLAERAAQRGGFSLSFRSDAVSAGHRADRVLYRCGRELLTNVVKHADAEHVEVELSLADGVAVLAVRDDGVGLPVDGNGDGEGQEVDGSGQHPPVTRGHIGLSAQRIRVEEAGGTLVLGPNRPRGTTATVTLPLPPPETAGHDGTPSADAAPEAA
ncbi:sensor histidine kinase [Streptacidiphilus fuscans]|uniref:Sensor histidine kinase n=1 Tax=Streptacidiphilus fuscans TaxID=2789292 RepID=A0A931AYF2_9ACTN|nr:sensor histidine kinase [Streptacidiphilus fuscans]MBF9066853.1 sensor histidine kinase [Streptacidiphilus fuscans]